MELQYVSFQRVFLFLASNSQGLHFFFLVFCQTRSVLLLKLKIICDKTAYIEGYIVGRIQYIMIQIFLKNFYAFSGFIVNKIDFQYKCIFTQLISVFIEVFHRK